MLSHRVSLYLLPLIYIWPQSRASRVQSGRDCCFLFTIWMHCWVHGPSPCGCTVESMPLYRVDVLVRPCPFIVWMYCWVHALSLCGCTVGSMPFHRADVLCGCTVGSMPLSPYRCTLGSMPLHCVDVLLGPCPFIVWMYCWVHALSPCGCTLWMYCWAGVPSRGPADRVHTHLYAILN